MKKQRAHATAAAEAVILHYSCGHEETVPHDDPSGFAAWWDSFFEGARLCDRCARLGRYRPGLLDLPPGWAVADDDARWIVRGDHEIGIVSQDYGDPHEDQWAPAHRGTGTPAGSADYRWTDLATALAAAQRLQRDCED